MPLVQSQDIIVVTGPWEIGLWGAGVPYQVQAVQKLRAILAGYPPVRIVAMTSHGEAVVYALTVTIEYV